MKKKSTRLSTVYRLFIIPITLLFFSLHGCSTFDSSHKNNLDSKLTDLKVMTFNIRYGSADDGENSWQYRKNMVWDLISDENPDIFGLQEAEKFQIDEILEHLPEYEFAGVGRDDGKAKGEYSPIFYSKHRFILDSTVTFWFSDTPSIPGSKTWGNNFPRICTWAKLFDKFSGSDFYFMNLHLDHQSVPSRIKSAKTLTERIKNFKEMHPVILTGDFNCGEDEETITQILNFGLIDSYRSLNKKSNNEGTFNGFTGDDTNDKIDYIFTSPQCKPIDAKIIKSNVNGKFPSDHFPVTAKFVIINK